MTTNLFVIANVKQLRTGGSFRILLPFFRTSWGCWRPKFSNFLTVFAIGLSLARFWRAFGISRGGGGFHPPQTLLDTPLPVTGLFFFYFYLLPDEGRMNCRNMSQGNIN